MSFIKDLFNVGVGAVKVTYNGVMGGLNTLTGNEDKGREQLNRAAGYVGTFVGEVKHRIDSTPTTVATTTQSVRDSFRSAFESRANKTQKEEGSDK